MKHKNKLTLPEKLSHPADSLSRVKFLLYGREKIGKTCLASQFPEALFLLTEPGDGSLRLMKRDIHDWSDFIGYVKLIERSDRFETVVVDTIDLAYKLCERAACRELGISHPSDEKWAKGWNAVRDEFTRWMVRLGQCGRGIIWISHETEREIERHDGSSEMMTVPSMANMARGIIEPMADLIARFTYDERKRRILQIRGDGSIVAGTRLERRFYGYDEIRMGKSKVAAFRNFMEAFEARPPRRRGRRVIVKGH